MNTRTVDRYHPYHIERFLDSVCARHRSSSRLLTFLVYQSFFPPFDTEQDQNSSFGEVVGQSNLRICLTLTKLQ